MDKHTSYMRIGSPCPVKEPLVIYTKGMRTPSPLQRLLIYPIGLRTEQHQQFRSSNLRGQQKHSGHSRTMGKDMRSISNPVLRFLRVPQLFEFLRNL